MGGGLVFFVLGVMEKITKRVDLFNQAVNDLWTDSINSETIKTVVDLGTALIKLADSVGLGNIAIIGLGIAFGGIIGLGAAGVIIAIISVVDELTVSLKELETELANTKSKLEGLESEKEALTRSEELTAEEQNRLDILNLQIEAHETIIGLQEKELAQRKIDGSFWQESLNIVKLLIRDTEKYFDVTKGLSSPDYWLFIAATIID